MALEMCPSSYLEIGVRRGFSMAVLASRAQRASIVGIDRWIRGYAGSPNPGPRFVRKEIEKTGHSGDLHLVKGDSHRVLRTLLAGKRTGFSRLRKVVVPRDFDLITVDGDHSLLGAYADLTDAFQLCAIGGAVIMDDIAAQQPLTDAAMQVFRKELGPDPHSWGSLLGVWRAAQSQFPQFRYFEFSDEPPGTALALRIG
ncbi:MAG: class I SAM-dependent methyltransferase [Actinobacteria bacterium]|nr:class I SAM-dependent methyltransferase [Actinomycetota bacterium]MCL5444863.1 class I SAM-dependent methyltransferase [Actinomycetota bacterium]